MAKVSWDSGRTKTLTIAQSGTTTDVLDLGSDGTWSGMQIGILSPAALTGTVTVEVCDTEAGTFRTLQSDGSDIALTATKAAVLDPVPFRYLRIKSSGAEASARNFVLVGRRV